MIAGKTAIGVIPARGGSKGLPGKNIRSLCGKPLLAWSIEKARKSKCLDLVVVSTDTEQIAAVAREHGASVPFLRPSQLATDTAPTYDVVHHALGHLEREGRVFDYTVLLEPTSPLREDDDIDKILTHLDGSSADFDAAVTVGEVGEHPSIMKRLVGPGLEAFCASLTQTTRRQDNDPAYFPYGVAYAVKTPILLAEHTFYPQRCTYYRIKRYQRYEIDDLYDFLCVEAVMRHEWGQS